VFSVSKVQNVVLKLLNSEQNVQVSDTTKVDRSNDAETKKIKPISALIILYSCNKEIKNLKQKHKKIECAHKFWTDGDFSVEQQNRFPNVYDPIQNK
jgi:hypothetical protein